jgi:hypothetical protein
MTGIKSLPLSDVLIRDGSNRTLELELCASWVVHRIRGMLKSGPGMEAGIAQQGGAYYPTVMTTISLKLPGNLLARLERERRLTKGS